MEPCADDKLIDPFDRPFDNLKKTKGMFESAITRFNQKSKLHSEIESMMCGYLKLKEASFVFKRVYFGDEFFKKDDKLDSTAYKELDLLYSQCLVGIATNFIILKSQELIEYSALYLLFTYGSSGLINRP